MSLRAAINAKCRDCIYDPASGLGTWRAQVARCTAVDCPIWPVRPGPESGPYQRPQIDDVIARDADLGHRERDAAA